MSLLNIDDDQRWVPTHVQVTVLRGRGLRAKGKHGTSDVYTIIQVGKEKFSTCVVEKTIAPEWKEECSFELLPGVLEAEGRSVYPLGSSDLVLTVMHRALIGLDVFLGQAIIPLDKVFQDRICMRNEWYKLNSKTGKKEKERGEVQVTVQFTRNNLTASMYDLSMKDKPRSTFGKLKERMKGKKREDSESASAIVPGGFGALAHRRGRLPSDGGGEEEYEDDEGGEGRRSKMRNFFLRGKLRKSSDTRSSTSLGSESSESSSRGGSLSPTAGISVVVSDLSNSPSESSNLTADNSPDHTTHPSPKIITHKRAFSDEASQITAAPPQPRLVVSLKAQSGVLSQSSLCINGSHVYAAEPMASGSAATLPATLGLLQKCSPLSRSLQNLTRRSDDPQRAMSGAEGRRWSFDKAGKEEKAAIAAALEQQGRPVQATAPLVPVVMVAEPANEGKKPKRNIFSHGRSESAGRGSDQAKVEQGQPLPPAEEKHKGWFGSKDSHNKPSPEVSPKCNPFFVELLADQALKSDPTAPCLFSSPLWSPAVSSSRSDDLSPTKNCLAVEHTKGPTPSCPPEALSVCIMNALPLETPMGQTSEVVKADENNAAAENASPALPQRPTKIPVLEGRQNHWFNWTQEPGMKKDSYLPPQNEMVSAEHTKEEERCGKELIPSQEDTTDTVTEPGPPMSPVPQALKIETLSEDPDSGNPSGTCSIHSAEINLQGLPVETEGNKRASSSEEVGLSSTISQDLIMDLMPADFCRPQDKKECLEAPRQGPLNPEPFLQLHPHNLFSEFNIDTPPEGITAAIIPEGLHANAVPSPRSHPPIGGDPTSSLFLHDCNPQASSTPFLLAETNAQFAHFPSPIPAHMLMRPTTETTQASSTIPPSKAQPMIGTTFAGLPQETQPAAGLLPSHQSSPHPVKPLTTTAPQEEKKSEGRSVLVSGLEKLKSTIHPGRAAHQGEPETDRNKQALSEGAAPYYHLTHNELVSLLLQREAELERQQAEFERQGVLLEKRELEVKKMKVLIRDLEDYIDTLLVRIMEQTPTLLQVRSKLK
ncbi:hypothetical protein AAFF_G00119300 [Aldrovandia affinis]|uniref:Rab11 family-interacting protein 5 n=1 Tax=Aldrovandia affinis TaxID=143900 RepID=A0AAD7RSQ6_9TELE|nr:hypothetical protein AAFF_G00119300 [Aldrovandia affinis]